MAKTETTKTENAKTENTNKKPKSYYDELVKVNIFKDNDRYKDDIFVAVNGVGIMVPRGKEVEIPRKYAEVLRLSEIQDGYAADYQLKLMEQSGDSALN